MQDPFDTRAPASGVEEEERQRQRAAFSATVASIQQDIIQVGARMRQQTICIRHHEERVLELEARLLEREARIAELTGPPIEVIQEGDVLDVLDAIEAAGTEEN